MKPKQVITAEEFKARLQRLYADTPSAKRIIEACGGYTKLPPHLKEDALRRMKLREVNDPLSGAIWHEDISGEENS